MKFFELNSKIGVSSNVFVIDGTSPQKKIVAVLIDGAKFNEFERHVTGGGLKHATDQ